MAFNIYEALTAISTAATGLLVFMQYRTQRALAAPHLTGRIEQIEGGKLLTTVRIHPADFAIRFHKISIRNAKLAAAKHTYVAGGRVAFSVDGDWAKSLPVSIEIPPSRFSHDTVGEHFFIKLRSSQSSALISLHTRVMWLPVRYKIKLPITINT